MNMASTKNKKSKIDNSVFMKWLNQKLYDLKWSRYDLAQKAHISESVLSLYETNRRRPSPDILIPIAGALGISQVEVLRRAGIITEQDVDGNEMFREFRNYYLRLPKLLQFELVVMSRTYVKLKGELQGELIDELESQARSKPLRNTNQLAETNPG